MILSISFIFAGCGKETHNPQQEIQIAVPIVTPNSAGMAPYYPTAKALREEMEQKRICI